MPVVVFVVARRRAYWPAAPPGGAAPGRRLGARALAAGGRRQGAQGDGATRHRWRRALDQQLRSPRCAREHHAAVAG